MVAFFMEVINFMDINLVTVLATKLMGMALHKQ